jgi:autotransporter-associated beta strand protein
MRLISILAMVLATCVAQAQTINAVYFGQTHVLKATDPYFGLVGNRETLIKVHVTAPGAPASPAVTATLSLSGQTPLVLTLTGPATLPASIPDGLGVVQHSFTNTFTGYIPAAWVKTGLQVTVRAGTATTTITNMKVSAPTKVIMTMTDVQYFSDTNSDYPSGIFAEVEAKWPVADLEVRRLGHVVFPELVIPPRTDVGAKAVRIRSKAEYTAKTGLAFDGEQAAALAWNGALKRAAGRSGRWSLFYLNVYNAFAGGQAGGFAGVGSGTSVGILHHELGHALSLPHWGDSASYPYKGAMHGISAPSNYNGTHAGPAWAFHLPTKKFIPPTVQTGNVGGKPVGTYKVDPMQGGGTGFQEPGYQLNHFSDYSVNQMRNYLNDHVVVWNPALGTSGSWAEWNQTTGGYTTSVSNNGVQFPTTRDTQVISIMASISGSDPDVTMVYPPIGPYTSGLIRLFDPTVAADRTAANNIFSPTNGSDLCVRVVQGGVTKTYMLAASWVTSQDPFSSGSLVTEAINLPASSGAVTKIELLLTPDAEVNGLPANPQVLSTWAPLTPEPAEFELAPTAYSNSAVTMKAVKGNLAFGFTGTVEYQFTETTGNPGATSSGWQTSRTYTDTGLQAGTQYSYTVSMRAGSQTATTSAAASATTLAAVTNRSATVNSTQQFSLPANLEGFQPVTGLGTFDAGTADKLVVVVSTEDKNNSGTGYVYDVRYNGKVMTEVIQEEAGSGNGTAAIFYLDNPGPKGTGTIEVSAESPNGGIGAAYALSNTMPGFAVTNSRTGNAANSVTFTTAGVNSVVIAVLENSGNPNSSGTPTVNSAAATPLTQVSSGSWGGGYGGHASGYRLVATPSSVTPAFTTTTGSGYSINLAAAEFPAKPPQPNIWAQTAGGTQNWTTNTNWEDAIVPAPTSSTTMDFSAVDLVADTALVLAAARTARIWKFGDTSGTQNWTINSGNTMTLAGTTPTIEVKNNTTQLNNVVAGTAGLTKTGTGTLFLNSNNSYTGVTRISAGTLQATTLANGGSNSSIGASPNAVGNLILNGGTLRYTGAAVSTNRLFSLQASSSIDASGTGAVNFTNIGAMGFSSSTADKTLTLTGNNTGSNTLAAIIGDNLTTVTVGDQDITTGVTSLTKSGTGTWVLSGANTFTGGTIINGGTLRLANALALQNSSQVNINNGSNAGTLELATDAAFATFPLIGGGSGAEGSIISNRATAGAGITHVLGAAFFGNNTYNFTSGSNVTGGTGGVSFATVDLSGGVNGTTIFNPTTANLTIIGGVTIPSGGTTKTLNLGGASTGNSIGGAISNGIGTLSLIKSNTSIWTLSGLSTIAANNYSGSTTIDNGTLRITTTNPSFAGSLVFGASAGSSNTGTLDLNAASATFATNLAVQTNSPDANNLIVGSGRTLTINGNVTIGANIAGAVASLVASGGGNMVVGTGGTNTFIVGGATGSTLAGNTALDLSGLASFTVNYGSGGTFRLGDATTGSNLPPPSTLKLATDNTITVGNFRIGDFSGGQAIHVLTLGNGDNFINATTTNIGSAGAGIRSSGSMIFAPSDTTGTLKLRGFDGGSTRTILNMVNTTGNTAASLTSIADWAGHTVDANVSTLTMARRTVGAGGANSTLSFDQGLLDITTLNMSNRSGTAGGVTATVNLGDSAAVGVPTVAIGSITMATSSGTGTATANLNITGGNVGIGSGTGTAITMSNAGSGATAASTLAISGGTVTVDGDIMRASGGGTETATVRLNGGTLNMNGHDLGASGSGVLTFTAESGTLQNITSINGTGGLTKTTTGTLVLQGNNTYSGNTTISGGTLALGSSNALPATALWIDNATLNAATFTDTVGTLDVSGNAVIQLGSGASLAFADSSTIDWSGGTLAITGTFVSGSSLRFGTSSTALSTTQLSKISGGGFTSFSLNSSGYLVGSNGATFTSWQTTNSTAGAFNTDHDSDGVSNGIEYFIGGSSNTTGHTTLPGVTNTNGTLSVTWNKSASYPGIYGTDFWVESSDSLTGTWTLETAGGNVIINSNTITYTFPSGTKRFVRLKVQGPQ